jgi:Rrf2 family protein
VKLSKRGEYALRVLVDLAMARSEGEPLVSLAVLAQAQSVPSTFLEQILLSMRQGGYLVSTRGKHGGYALAQPEGGFSMGRVIRFLEGSLAPVACVSQSAYQRCSCPDEKNCGVRQLMLEAREALCRVFDGTTLEALAERTLAGWRASGGTPPILELLKGASAAKGGGARRNGEPEYLI